MSLVAASKVSIGQQALYDTLKIRLMEATEDTSRIDYMLGLGQQGRSVFGLDTTFYWADQAMMLAKKISDQKRVGICHQLLTFAFSQKGDTTHALSHAKIALDINRQLRDTGGIARSLVMLASIYSRQDRFSEAVPLMFESVAIFERKKMAREASYTYQELGRAYLLMLDTSIAYEYFARAEAILKSIEPDLLTITNVERQMGWLDYFRGNYEEAIKKQRSVLQDALARQNVYTTTHAHIDIGENFEKLAEKLTLQNNTVLAKTYLDSAVLYLQSAMRYSESDKEKRLTSYSATVLGRLYLAQKKLSIAEKTLLLAIDSTLPSTGTSELADAYRSLSELYTLKKNFSKAYEYYKQSVVLRDSAEGATLKQRLEGLKIKYQVQQKESDIKMLTASNQLKTTQASNENQNRNFAFLGIGALVLVGSSAMFGFNRRRKLRSRQDLLNERLQISSQLNTEVGSTLNRITNNREKAATEIESNRLIEAEKHLVDMQENSSSMVSKLGDIVWLLNPQRECLSDLISRIEDFIRTKDSTGEITVDIIMLPKLSGITLSIELRKNLYELCKEYLQLRIDSNNLSRIVITILKTAHNLRFSILTKSLYGTDLFKPPVTNGKLQESAGKIGASVLITAISETETELSILCSVKYPNKSLRNMN